MGRLNLRLQHDRAHQDEDFEISLVKFRPEIKKLRAITYRLHRNIDHVETLIAPASDIPWGTSNIDHTNTLTTAIHRLHRNINRTGLVWPEGPASNILCCLRIEGIARLSPM